MSEILTTEQIAEKVKQFTADDFSLTTSPYDFLYSLRANSFVMEQIRLVMKKHADSVGVSGFIGAWRNYLKGKPKEKSLVPSNFMRFSDREVPFSPGTYDVTDNGVLFVDKNGFETVVCPHPIYPFEILKSIEANNNMKLRVAFKIRNKWLDHLYDRSDICNSSKIVDAMSNQGIAVTSSSGKYLSDYLIAMEQENIDLIPEHASIERLGWIGNTGLFSPYVEDLHFVGESNFSSIYKSVQPCGSLDKWVDIIGKVREENIAARIFIAGSFASCLVKPLGILPFFVHFLGISGVGKTVALMMAASVWGDPESTSLVGSFDSTAVGLERKAAFLNSVPLFLDELSIKTAKGETNFDSTIYHLCEGRGRLRGKKAGGVEDASEWRLCILTTGEESLLMENSAGGAVNRVVEIKTSGPTYHDMPTLCDIIKQNYGLAGKEFVEKFTTPTSIDVIKKQHRAICNELQNLGATDKQAASGSIVFLVDQLISEYFFKGCSPLTVYDMAKILVTKQQMDPNKRAFDFFWGWVAENTHKFQPHDKDNTPIWGRVYGDKVFVLKSVFDREMQKNGVNAKSFLNWLYENGHLETDNEPYRKTKKAVVFSGSKENCVCVIREKEGNEDIAF